MAKKQENVHIFHEGEIEVVIVMPEKDEERDRRVAEEITDFMNREILLKMRR